jgi:hypothetical protein
VRHIVLLLRFAFVLLVKIDVEYSLPLSTSLLLFNLVLTPDLIFTLLSLRHVSFPVFQTVVTLTQTVVFAGIALDLRR